MLPGDDDFKEIESNNIDDEQEVVAKASTPAENVAEEVEEFASTEVFMLLDGTLRIQT